jgi:hypothetical protein
LTIFLDAPFRFAVLRDRGAWRGNDGARSRKNKRASKLHGMPPVAVIGRTFVE